MDSFSFIPILKDTTNNKTMLLTYQPLDSVYLVKKEDVFKEVENMIGKDSYANLISTVALICTLVIFNIQNKKSNKDKRIAIKQNWFITIIVQPNLNGINEFYNNISDRLINELDNLRAITRPGRIAAQKATTNRVLKKIKSDFFDNFVTIVQSYESELATQIEEVLNDLQDLCSESIDSYENVEYNLVRKKIFENKATLISILFNGIKGKEKWYKSFFKWIFKWRRR